MREDRVRGRTFTVKIKWADFQQSTRSRSLPRTVESRDDLRAAARADRLGLPTAEGRPPGRRHPVELCGGTGGAILCLAGHQVGPDDLGELALQPVVTRVDPIALDPRVVEPMHDIERQLPPRVAAHLEAGAAASEGERQAVEQPQPATFERGAEPASLPQGVLSVFTGIVLAIAPLIGAVVLTWWIGAYAIVFGATLLVLAFRLRSHRAEVSRGATPHPA